MTPFVEIVGDHPLDEKREGLPAAYRQTSDSTLFRYSASGQPNAVEFANLITQLKNKGIPAEQIIIVDLRAEQHCFMNGISVAFLPESSESLEHNLKSFQSSSTPFSYRPSEKHEDKKTVVIESLQSEPEYLNELGIKKDLYVSLPVTDNEVPTEELVDRFIDLAKSMHNTTQWMHLHCHGGKGRTSQFAAMLVLIQLQLKGELDEQKNLLEVLKEYLDKNSFAKLTKEASSADSDKDAAPDKKRQRLDLLESFFTYLKDSDGFASDARWSDWSRAKRHSIHIN